jgi:hypothetical protein
MPAQYHSCISSGLRGVKICPRMPNCMAQTVESGAYPSTACMPLSSQAESRRVIGAGFDLRAHMSRREPVALTRLRLIGCCGANCGTCRSFIIGQCVGCKLGCDDGTRNLKVSKCEVKRYCLGKGTLVTCADCDDYPKCRRIRAFHVRKGSKYADYRRPVDYIRRLGYRRYLRMARLWKGPYGPLN